MNDQTVVPNYDQIWKHVYGDMQDIGPVHRHMRRIVRNLLTTIEYRKVVEIGCGAGHNLELICRGRKIDYTGVDISNVALEKTRRVYPPGEYVQLDIQEEDLDGTWDLVFCSLLMEHIPEDVAALRHMYRMTGKYLLITTIAGNFEKYRSWEEKVGHVRNYRVGELEEKVQKAGFELVRVVYWGYPFYSPIFRSLQGGSSSAVGKVSPFVRLAAGALYRLYFLNSMKHGDLIVLLAKV